MGGCITPKKPNETSTKIWDIFGKIFPYPEHNVKFSRKPLQKKGLYFPKLKPQTRLAHIPPPDHITVWPGHDINAEWPERENRGVYFYVKFDHFTKENLPVCSPYTPPGTTPLQCQCLMTFHRCLLPAFCTRHTTPPIPAA